MPSRWLIARSSACQWPGGRVRVHGRAASLCNATASLHADESLGSVDERHSDQVAASAWTRRDSTPLTTTSEGWQTTVVRFAWIDERPFNYEGPDGLMGCDVALARRAFAALDRPFEPVHATFEELLPGLRDRRWDVTTGMFVTPERQAQAFFTRPIWSLRDGLLVTRVNRHITGYTVLANERLKVAVLSGQVQRDHALRLGVDAADLLEFSSYSQAAEAVLQGRAAAYASVALAHTEHLSALAEHQRWRLTSVTVPSIEVSPAFGAFACASDDIRIALDGALAELVGSDSPGEPSAEPSAWVGA